MPVTKNGYEKLTEEEIKRSLENKLKEKLGTEAQPGDLVTKQLEAEAETLAQNQEESLERVYNAAYLSDATGNELDKVVDIIGLTRKEATSATGVVELSRSTPPNGDFVIPRGSSVQTSGSQPVEFTVTKQTKLSYIDGFEDGTLGNWDGDTGYFSVIDTQEIDGSKALQTPSESGYKLTSNKSDFGIGSTFTAKIKPESGDGTSFEFGIQNPENYLECEVRQNAQDLTLRLLEDNVEEKLSTNSISIPSDSVSYLEIEWGLYKNTTATLYETENRDVKLGTVSINENVEWEDGPIAIKSINSGASAIIDDITTRSVLTNIEGEDSGVKTNVSPNTITVIPTPITGVESVTNPKPTGDPTVVDSNFSELVTGREREDDEDFRERAFQTTSIGGSATLNAINTALQQIEDVKAITINRNRTGLEDDKGLPPHSFEAIVYGGSNEEVGTAIFETAAIDSHDVGGINGKKEANYTITSDVTGKQEKISWSRPTEVTLDITLDLIVDDTFVGEADIRSIVVDYVGGTGIDGSFINGIDVGEDLYESILKRRLVSPEKTGVWEVNSMTITDGTDTTETKPNGADVFAVTDSEVATTNARDGSITVNTTQK